MMSKLDELLYSVRQEAEAIAAFLMECKHYDGTQEDAEDDAFAMVRHIQFAPPLGDNHHNAFNCPYCGPKQEVMQELTAWNELAMKVSKQEFPILPQPTWPQDVAFVAFVIDGLTR